MLNNLFYIFNLDSKAGPGTHWIVIYNCNPTQVIYFDPFGVDPPEELLSLMRKTKKQMIMNTYRIQALASKSCGVYCVYIIDNLNRGDTFLNILTHFSPADYEQNEKVIAFL